MCPRLRHCLQVNVSQFRAPSPSNWPSLKYCLTLGCQKRLIPIIRTIYAVQALQFEVSLRLPLCTYSHIYLCLKDVSWPMMHCRRRLLPSGIRLLWGRQQRLLSAASHVINSALPDVVIPNTAVADYVWQRVDKWPDKVAIVSIHRPSKDIRVTSGSRQLAQCIHCQRSQVHRRPLKQGCYVRTQKTVLWERRTFMSR